MKIASAMTSLTATLLFAGSSSALISVDLVPTDVRNGFSIYTLTATSDDPSVLVAGIDAGGGSSTHTGFQGVNNVHVFGVLPTPTLNNVNIGATYQFDMSTDSHFLFLNSELVAAFAPYDGPAGESSTLNGLFWFPEQQAQSVDIAQIVIKGTNLKVLPYIVGEANATVDVIITDSTGGPTPAQFSVVPEPTSLSLLGLGGLILIRRR